MWLHAAGLDLARLQLRRAALSADLGHEGCHEYCYKQLRSSPFRSCRHDSQVHLAILDGQ